MTSKMELDLTASARPIWLVKVPKYVAQRWEKSDKNGHIGKIRVGKKFGKPDISLVMDERVAKTKLTPDDPDIPVEHKLQVMSALPGTMMVYSTGTTDKLSVEGKVVERLECRPVGSDSYMLMKRKQIELAHKPTKVTQQIKDRPVNAYKPISRHKELDLCRITQQPVPYLKEMLQEIGTYHQKAPHKYMWELKAEYRHYKSEQNDMDTS
eukprot:XP_011681754.1 PREDICTED: general transcription factor IIF subunit 2 [Strongylocentrotus purpuratus]